jgi:hypothetical protein
LSLKKANGTEIYFAKEKAATAKAQRFATAVAVESWTRRGRMPSGRTLVRAPDVVSPRRKRRRRNRWREAPYITSDTSLKILDTIRQNEKTLIKAVKARSQNIEAFFERPYSIGDKIETAFHSLEPLIEPAQARIDGLEGRDESCGHVLF